MYSCVQCLYTRLDVMKTSICGIIPSFANNQFLNEKNIILISNFVFYLTFIFLLYITYKSFTKLVSLSKEYSIYQDNFIFKFVLRYFNTVFFTVLLLIIISFIFDLTLINAGEYFARTPLHYTRLFKLIIGLTLLILNVTIKIINGEKLRLWDRIKVVLLFMPIIVQYLMDYNLYAIFLMLLASLSSWQEFIGINYMMGGAPQSDKLITKDKSLIPTEVRADGSRMVDHSKDPGPDSSSIWTQELVVGDTLYRLPRGLDPNKYTDPLMTQKGYIKETFRKYDRVAKEYRYFVIWKSYYNSPELRMEALANANMTEWMRNGPLPPFDRTPFDISRPYPMLETRIRRPLPPLTPYDEPETSSNQDRKGARSKVSESKVKGIKESIQNLFSKGKKENN